VAESRDKHQGGDRDENGELRHLSSLFVDSKIVLLFEKEMRKTKLVQRINSFSH